MKKNFVCVACDPEKFFETDKAMVAHFKKVHPEDFEVLWGAIGKTWSEPLSRALRERDSARRLAQDTQAELHKLIEHNNKLVTKWNALLLVIQA